MSDYLQELGPWKDYTFQSILIIDQKDKSLIFIKFLEILSILRACY